MIDPLRLAIGTLTAVPVPAPVSLRTPVPGRAMMLAPLVGLIPGTASALTAAVAVTIGLAPAVTAVLVVGMFALVTRGLHLDGLADTADGLAASYDRVKALAVMRRGDTGPNGLAAVVLVLLLQCAALSQVLAEASAREIAEPGAEIRSVLIVIVVAVAARSAIPLTCVRGVPSARPEGLGATVAGSVGPEILAAILLATAAGCSLIAVAGGLPWWSAILAVIAVALTTGLLVLRARQRFGGITGDVIGAGVEIGTAAAALVLAAAG